MSNVITNTECTLDENFVVLPSGNSVERTQLPHMISVRSSTDYMQNKPYAVCYVVFPNGNMDTIEYTTRAEAETARDNIRAIYNKLNPYRNGPWAVKDFQSPAYCISIHGYGTSDTDFPLHNASIARRDVAAIMNLLNQPKQSIAAPDEVANYRDPVPKADDEAPASGWQSIETAPLDGTYVDIWTASGTRLTDCRYDVDGATWNLYARYEERPIPTHWMPIPAGPEVEQ